MRKKTAFKTTTTRKMIWMSFFGLAEPCKPVGVADRLMIPDSSMTASSVYSSSYYPYYGRFNETRGARRWCPRTTSNRRDYIQIDVGSVISICAIATQGTRSSEYTTSYKLQFSANGATWDTYKVKNSEKVLQYEMVSH